MSEEKSAWQKYKESLGDTRPWDFLRADTQYAETEESKRRFEICKSCPELIKLTSQCKKCGCFMAAKTRLLEATCPIGKW